MELNSATSIILESISDGVFTVDQEWRVTSFNRAAESITGVAREEALGRPCHEVFRASMCEGNCALRQTLESGQPIVDRSAYIVDAAGERIPISVSTALLRDEDGTIIGGAETFRDLTLVEELRKAAAGDQQLGELVSRSAAMQRLFAVVPQVAASPCTVLITGETGTGKELLARAIHAHSPRRDGPFVAVNCGALPETLLESELFGHRRGAFTGADQDREGRFAMAEGGTLFLDEIGDIPPAFQVRLLRVLQERVYEPVGSSQSIAADVRILAATHRDLDQLVAAGSFREDLYYRIKVVQLELPPLRHRREDIPCLTESLIARLNCLHGKEITGVTPAVMGLLMGHDFRGNVRELENILEHGVVLCDAARLDLQHLPPELRGGTPGLNTEGGIRQSIEAVEADAIRRALVRHHGNRQAAAKALGMHKSTLYRKVAQLGIELPDADGRQGA